MDHTLPNGERCAGPWQPCEEPGCPESGALKGWRSIAAILASDPLQAEIDGLRQRVIETFGVETYEAAIIKANAIYRKTPNDPRAMSVALRDELRRLLGPH